MAFTLESLKDSKGGGLQWIPGIYICSISGGSDSGCPQMTSRDFDSLKEVRKIVILGHSLSDVDMPYFDKIANSIMKDQVEWEISYHTHEDINRIHHFCKRYGISAQPTLL